MRQNLIDRERTYLSDPANLMTYIVANEDEEGNDLSFDSANSTPGHLHPRRTEVEMEDVESYHPLSPSAMQSHSRQNSDR